MVDRENRLTEKISIGIYFVVALSCLVGYFVVQNTSGPRMGGSFLVIGAFWITVVIGLSSATVILISNAMRGYRERNPDIWAIAFSGLMVAAILTSLYLAFVVNRLDVAFISGSIGLILAPVILLFAILNSRIIGIFPGMGPGEGRVGEQT